MSRWLRRGSLPVLAAALTLLSAQAGEQPKQAKQPVSVLLVTLDTTRADHLGCYGAGFASTPVLDGLAGAGARFERALSPSPLTLPSHASLFTGQVPRRHGVRNNALFRLGPEPQVLAGLFRGNGYRTAAFVSSMVLDRIAGLDRGFDHYDDTVRVGPRDAFNHEERAAVQTNEAVFAHLESLEPPFFLWVHYFDPHLPYVPPEPFRERFQDRPYDGEIAFMDAQLGELLQAVRKKGGPLLVVVAGDHGESLGDHGEAAHGIFVYQATQHVPLILAGPGVPRETVVKSTVGLIDVAPTLLDLAGLPPMTDSDGGSLVPVIRNEKAAPRDYEMEALFPLHAYGWSPLRALVRGRHKFIEAPRQELYDLDADPGESTNLAAKQGKRAVEMAAELRRRARGDAVWPDEEDPELAEQRRRLEALGYLGGGGPSDEAPSIDPKDGVTWIADLEAGRRAYQTGKPEQGLEPLLRLLERNPRNVPALLALAMCYLGMNQPDPAVAADRRALEIRPDDELVHFNLANALAAAGRARPEGRAEAWADARTHYERALQLNPRFADAYLNYAAFLEGAGADGEAFALLGRARKAGVRDPGVETRVAVLELKRGEVEAAKVHFRAALELDPTDAGPLEAMARISERQGHRAEALAYYRRLLERIPPGDPSREALRRRVESLTADTDAP